MKDSMICQLKHCFQIFNILFVFQGVLALWTTLLKLIPEILISSLILLKKKRWLLLLFQLPTHLKLLDSNSLMMNCTTKFIHVKDIQARSCASNIFPPNWRSEVLISLILMVIACLMLKRPQKSFLNSISNSNITIMGVFWVTL